MKGEVAASAVALATLSREGWRGSGDLIFVAAADEEVGDGFGLGGWSKRIPTRCAPTSRSTRARATGSSWAARSLYLCSTAEKMSSPFLLRVHGRSGHASMPAIADNALVKAAPLIERLGAFSIEPTLIPEVEGFLQACSARFRQPATRSPQRGRLPARGRADRAAALDDRRADQGACLREAQRDPRALRDHHRHAAPARPVVRGGRGHDPRLASVRATTSSSTPSGRAARGRRSAARSGTRCRVRRGGGAGRRAAPMCVAGFTDSHWLREAFGTVAYGFFPSRAMDAGDRGAPDPLRRRAGAGRRPRARRSLAAARGRHSLLMLELHEADGAFARSSSGSPTSYAGGSAPTSISATACPSPCAARRPGAARAVPAAAPRRDRATPSARPGARRVRGRRVGAVVVGRRVRARRSRRCARRSRAVTSTRSTSCSISRRRSTATPRRSPRRSRRFARCIRGRSSATAGRSSPRRPSSSSRGAATGCRRCRSRARARPGRTSMTRRTRPST